jgi:hypothetical protein
MATLNYITLKVPAILFKHIELIQKTPTFSVYRYGMQKGVIFRLPHGLQPGHMVHCFIEHEVNFSNTLKTGTLTLKVQCTFVPVTHGVFSGFKHLEGSYSSRYYDEDDYDTGGYSLECFKPDYVNPNNEIYVAPLPVGIKANLYEYLNEILFQHCDDTELLSKYAVNLGCQKDTIRKATYIPAPELNSDLDRAKKNHIQNINFFESAGTGEGLKLLPEQKQLGLFQ